MLVLVQDLVITAWFVPLQVWGALAGERQGTHAQFCITAENEVTDLFHVPEEIHIVITMSNHFFLSIPLDCLSDIY